VDGDQREPDHRDQAVAVIAAELGRQQRDDDRQEHRGVRVGPESDERDVATPGANVSFSTPSSTDGAASTGPVATAPATKNGRRRRRVHSLRRAATGSAVQATGKGHSNDRRAHSIR
jgi:hypothetical protein